MRFAQRAVPAALGLLLALCRVAYAQEDVDRLATATSLFEAAQDLVQRGQPEEACPKFEESYRLEPANGTLINLADCYERVGKTATAWLTFRQVATKSSREGQDERAQVARARERRLEPRLTKLRIRPNNAVAGLSVERDGVLLKAAALGVAVPVDPGTHRVVARAPGHRDWSKELLVAGEGKTIDVQLPALESLAAGPAPEHPPEPDEPGAPVSWQAPFGISLLAVGAAGVVAGIALGGVARKKADDADCDADDFCSPDGLAAREDAVMIGNVGTGVGVGGAIIGALGLALWLTAPDPAEGAAARLWLSPSSARLQLRFR